MNEFKYINKNTVFGFGNDILKNILTSRGVKNTELFLNLNDSVIEDYKLYDNIENVADLYIDSIKNESSIGILTDFDTDGNVSTSEFYCYTKQICDFLNKPFKCEYVLHTHKSHGLDDIEAFEKLLQFDLVIIPDAGSNDFKQLKELKNRGIKYIILDHHQADKNKLKQLNLYDTIVNNQLSDNIKNKDMVGVGVTYKFMKFVDYILNLNFSDKYLDLVAFGLVADGADMRNLECRYLVEKGMSLIKSNKGSCKLLNLIYKDKSYSMNNKMTINGMAFYMIPAINCIIRGGTNEERDILLKGLIGDVSKKYRDKVRGKGEVEFTTEEYVVRLYSKLKRKQDKIVKESVNMLSEQIEQYKLNNMEIMVIKGDDVEDSTYNRVIVNKLCDKYKKHALLLKHYYNDIYGGSASGYKNKEITDLRYWCKNTGLFETAEGHPMAFGVKLSENNIQLLYGKISKLESTDCLTYEVDGEYGDNINDNIVKMIGNFEDIWGGKLDEPIFAIRDIIVPSNNVSIMGKTKNTLKLVYNGISFIKFKSSEDEYNKIIRNKNNKFKIIGRFKVNEYNGSKQAQILIENYNFEKTEETVAFRF